MHLYVDVFVLTRSECNKTGDTYCSGQGGIGMMEKIYHTMKSVGVWNLVMGILLIVAGVVSGILLILNGAKLLKKKSDLLF